ncbi:hypothetical protein [Pyxidicoccus caerfyrddinensis]|uniref:hypothetical protein n=1 Tax=Pyxidicoccus caerfyrddinensis TaxID=2709663 RepID=UPI0013DCE602|nr:hypothetical protein [Pyxidicoccus caerfyrddinensis]
MKNGPSFACVYLLSTALMAGCGGVATDAEVAQPDAFTDSSNPPAVTESAVPAAPPEPDPETQGNVSAFTVTHERYPTSGARVSFDSYGDHLVVKDVAADGHSAVGVLYSYQTGSYYACWNPNGSGTVKDCNFNFYEGTWVAFIGCIGEHGSGRLLACSREWTLATTNN